MTDTVYRYRVGDRVIFHAPPSLTEHAGLYVVEWLLPDSGSGPSYVIKRVKGGHERVASERELGAVTSKNDAPAG